MKSQPNRSECILWAKRARGRGGSFSLALFISLREKVAPPFPTDIFLIGESRGLRAAGFGRPGVTKPFQNKGSEGRWQRRMDDSALFCPTRKLTLDVPRACISMTGPLKIQLSISRFRGWLYTVAGVTSVYSHNVWLLFSAHTLHNDSCCLTDASQRGQMCLSDTLVASNNAVCLNSPAVFLFLSQEKILFFFFNFSVLNSYVEASLKNS